MRPKAPWATVLRWTVLGAALAAPACMRAPAPYRFAVPGLPATSIVDAIARVYAAEKLATARVDPAGVVESRWLHTGRAHGFLRDGTPTTLVRRFATVVHPRDNQLHIELKVLLLRCGASARGDLERNSDCEPVTSVRKSEQAEIDALGERLRAAILKVR